MFNAPIDIASQKLRAPRNVRHARQNVKKGNEWMDSFSNMNRLVIEYEDIKLLVTVLDLILVSVNPVMIQKVREILRNDYDQAR